MTPKTAHLIQFGFGGHGVECSGRMGDGTPTKSHISGYDTPESFQRQLAQGFKPDYPPLAGVPVLDKRPALEKNAAYSFRSPMLDVYLEEGQVDRLETDAAASMLPGLSGGFEQLAALALAHKASGKKEPGPLDGVSLSEYVAWWLERGAVLGRMDETGTAIIWEKQ